MGSDINDLAPVQAAGGYRPGDVVAVTRIDRRPRDV